MILCLNFSWKSEFRYITFSVEAYALMRSVCLECQILELEVMLWLTFPKPIGIIDAFRKTTIVFALLRYAQD